MAHEDVLWLLSDAMADSLSLSRNVQSLFETLRSKSPHRGSQAAQLASDLYTLCIESVSSTELGIVEYYDYW